MGVLFDQRPRMKVLVLTLAAVGTAMAGKEQSGGKGNHFMEMMGSMGGKMPDMMEHGQALKARHGQAVEGGDDSGDDGEKGRPLSLTGRGALDLRDGNQAAGENGCCAEAVHPSRDDGGHHG